MNVIPEDIIEAFKMIPETRALYDEDPYLKEFESTVLKTGRYGGKCYIALSESCFFPEGGGQPGDVGFLEGPEGRIEVIDTQSIDGIIVHITSDPEVRISEREQVRGVIDWQRRYAHMKNHTASHVLYSAVREVLGIEKLMYMGFQIGAERSRMDINYGKPITNDQLHELELLCNKVALQNRPVKIKYMTREEAEGKYGDKLGITEVTPGGKVRVVEVEGWDAGLCCGTHVRSTAEVLPIKILGRLRLKKGVERIEFSAGEAAYRLFDEAVTKIRELTELFKVPTSELICRSTRLFEDLRAAKKEIKKIKGKYVEAKSEALLSKVKTAGKVNLIVSDLGDIDPETLKRIAVTLTKKSSSLVVFLGGAAEKAYIIGAAGKEALREGVNVKEVLDEAAHFIQGGGGGVAKIAQIGGVSINGLKRALEKCEEKILKP